MAKNKDQQREKKKQDEQKARRRREHEQNRNAKLDKERESVLLGYAIKGNTADMLSHMPSQRNPRPLPATLEAVFSLPEFEQFRAGRVFENSLMRDSPLGPRKSEGLPAQLSIWSPRHKTVLRFEHFNHRVMTVALGAIDTAVLERLKSAIRGENQDSVPEDSVACLVGYIPSVPVALSYALMLDINGNIEVFVISHESGWQHLPDTDGALVAFKRLWSACASFGLDDIYADGWRRLTTKFGDLIKPDKAKAELLIEYDATSGGETLGWMVHLIHLAKSRLEDLDHELRAADTTIHEQAKKLQAMEADGRALRDENERLKHEVEALKARTDASKVEPQTQKRDAPQPVSIAMRLSQIFG